MTFYERIKNWRVVAGCYKEDNQQVSNLILSIGS